MPTITNAAKTGTLTAAALSPRVPGGRATPACGQAAGKAQSSVSLPYIIYSLRERETGRYYVGLTVRTLSQRISAHASQARRKRKVRSGGLMDALRRMLDQGKRLAETWDVQVVARAATVDEARHMERLWIATLSGAWPTGFNMMPGGSSVGGPDNAAPITVRLPGKAPTTYACIQHAVSARNEALHRAGKLTVSPGVVYARLALGWSPAEALGYVPHEDGRGTRQPVIFAGRAFDHLRTVSAITGTAVSTLRSRLHRHRLSGTDAELCTDLRRAGARHTPTRSPPLGLRLPGSLEQLTVRAYSDRVGVSASTIQHRWHAISRSGFDPTALSPAHLLQRLTTAEDRRCLITVQFPSGQCLTGGERELIRQVLGDHALAASRLVHLSESGIRRRLRTMPECDRLDPVKVAGAFGFSTFGGEA